MNGSLPAGNAQPEAAPTVILCGGVNGPHRWALRNAGGRDLPSEPTTFSALAALRQRLEADGHTETANDLGRQLDALNRIAEAWLLRACSRQLGIPYSELVQAMAKSGGAA